VASKQIAVRLPLELANELAKRADYDGVTASEWIRQAVLQRLEYGQRLHRIERALQKLSKAKAVYDEETKLGPSSTASSPTSK
jgi:predicted DNA-binding protein